MQSVPIHRDADDELLGVVTADPDGLWTPCTVFGHPIGPATTRREAEASLQSHGLSYLAERWELRDGADWLAVQIQEAAPTHVTVMVVDYGHDERWGEQHRLAAPVGDVLRMA